MKKFLIVSLIFILAIFSILTYLGFIPYLSEKVVTKTDLGVKFDPEIIKEVNKEIGFDNKLEETDLPSKEEFVYKGKISIDRNLTSEEITSSLNTMVSEAYYTPFSNIQVRLNSDGTAETVMKLDIPISVQVAKSLGYSDSDIEKGKNFLGILGNSFSLYSKFSAEVEDNNVIIKPNTLRIRNFNVPSGYLSPIANAVSDIIEKKIAQVPNLDIQTFKQEGERVHFKGTMPKSIELAK